MRTRGISGGEMRVRTLLALCGLLLAAIIMIGIFAPRHEQMKTPEPGRSTFPQVLAAVTRMKAMVCPRIWPRTG